MVFCNATMLIGKIKATVVTILILIDGFLQYRLVDKKKYCTISHNPYFNRWFSAIRVNKNKENKKT